MQLYADEFINEYIMLSIIVLTGWFSLSLVVIDDVTANNFLEIKEDNNINGWETFQSSLR